MRYRVLGPLEVQNGDRAEAPPGTKERRILARLLLDAGRPVATGALLEAAWPDEDAARAARSLQVRLANLRGFLEPGRDAGTRSTLLVREGDGYRLAVAPDDVDAARFERLVRDARALPAADALAAYGTALALWRGEPFHDLAGDPAVIGEARRLEELRAHAVEAQARALLDLGRHDEAAAELGRLVAERPLDEEAAGSLALALYRAGRQVDALDALRALGARLRELGLEPAADTRALEQRILLHDPALGAAPAAPAPATTAPLRAPPLPRRPSRFFGREAHLARAAQLARDHALVSIVGVGGAGKTRLALELALRLAPDLEEAPWWCELAPAGEDDDVPGAVATAAGLPAGGVDRIADHLAARSALLVLDNCEHVLAGAARTAEALLERCPGLTVVATSRTPLGADGEQVLRLSGLDLPAGHAPDAAAAPAVALFVDRAQAAGGIVDPDADLDAIGELCRRLDGLPLAIELAAGRTRSLAPAEIAARLDERFSLLAVSGRRAASRHSTLGAAIDWSYQLLDERQRRLFERLSVFAPAPGLDDVLSVCSGDGVEARAVPDLLDDLVAGSLVTATAERGRTVYGLLETLREFGAARLEERGERAALRDRHADHHVRRALAARYGGWLEPRLPFVDDFDDLRAAVRWCMAADATPDRTFILVEALWWLAPSRYGEDVARLCDEALARWPAPAPWRERALGAASVAHLVSGDAARARTLADEAIAAERDGDEPALLARRTLAQLAFFTAEPEEALVLWREQAVVTRAAGHEAGACEADGFAVQLLKATGDTQAAVALAAAMRADADLLGSVFLAAWSRYVSGVAVLEDDPASARWWFTEALAMARAADHLHMVRFALRATGLAAAFCGDEDEAARRLAEALEHDEGRADAASQWTTLRAFAVLLARRGDAEAALALLAATEPWPAAPYLRALGERERERAAAALGADAAAGAQRRGRALTLAEAKALARRNR
jgi:predicted ATPase/DNA-binding SARP family transcriptional activator